MSEQKQELNEKIAKWVGFCEWTDGWHYPDKSHVRFIAGGKQEMPDFRHDLNALFRWAVPKLAPKTLEMDTWGDGYEWCILSDRPSGGLWAEWDEEPAMALALAIERLIDAEAGKP